MPVVPLRERVVEIALDLGPGPAERYRYGSGFRLGGRLALTAAHVVAGAPAAGITVRGPDKVPHPARVVDGLAGDPDTIDLALLELGDQAAELPPPPVATVDRDAPVPVPVEGCWAVGYPRFPPRGPGRCTRAPRPALRAPAPGRSGCPRRARAAPR